MSHNDWLRMLASIAGEPKLTNKLLKGLEWPFRRQLGYDDLPLCRVHALRTMP